MNIKALFKPKGILKILELIFCICAFAVLVSYEEDLIFTASCIDGPTTTTITTGTSDNSSSTTPTTESTESSSSPTPPPTTESTESSSSPTPPPTTESTESSSSPTPPPTTESTESSPSSTESSPSSTDSSPSSTDSSSSSTDITETTDTSEQTEKNDNSLDEGEWLKGPTTVKFNISVSYPFKLEKLAKEDENIIKGCDGKNATLVLEDKSSSKAVFFVFITVCGFLYAIIMMVIYVMDDVFDKMAAFPTLDLAIHVVFVIMLFCGCIAWAVGVGHLKTSTGEEQIREDNNKTFNCFDIDEDKNNCEVTFESYSGPVASIVLGFIDLLLFGVNIFFVFKETSYAS